jgi:hypothetical protein
VNRRLLAGAAGGAAVVALLVGTSLGWWNRSASEGRLRVPLAVSTSLAPTAGFFGDPVVARVSVSLDATAVSASTVTVQPDFSPYVQSGPPTVARSRSGSDETVVTTYSLQCDTDGCLPRSGPITLTFPPVAVTALSGTRRLKATGSWPAVVVSSRLQAADLRAAKPPFRHPAAAPPPVFGVDPGALADGLAAAAGLLAAVALVMLGLEIVRLTERRRAAFRLSRLEAALGLVREAAGRDDPADRRKALELLAETLAVEGRPSLAESAAGAAWAEVAPSPDRALELAHEVEALRAPEAE